MLRKAVTIFAISIFIFSLAGCATARRQNEFQVQGLKNQISVLEAQVQSKDEEISSLREALAKTATEATTKTGKKKVIGEVKSHPNAKQIQIALKNAGYNPGSIDGRMGKQTREAIRAFQKANNLKESGKADKETWDLLKVDLYKKVK